MAGCDQVQNKQNKPTLRCDEMKGLTVREVISELMTCVHCTESSQHVSLLPCGHSMCSTCLEDFKTADQSKDAEIWVPCPGMCNYTIVIKGGNLDKSILELKGIGLMSMLCQPERYCEEHSKADDATSVSPRLSSSTQSARFICTNCDIYLCRSCAQQHCIPHPWEHRIQNLDEYKADMMRDAFKCLKHGEKLAIFCTVCEEPVCHVCCAVNHSGHKLKELSGDEDIHVATKNILRQLGKVLTTAEGKRKGIHELKTRCEEQQVEAVDAVRTEEQRVTELVEMNADRLVKEITNVHSNTVEMIENTDNLVAGKQKMAQLMENLLSSAVESDSEEVTPIIRFYMENEGILKSGLPGVDTHSLPLKFISYNAGSHDMLGKVVNGYDNAKESSVTKEGSMLNSETVRSLSMASGSDVPELPEFETAEENARKPGSAWNLREILKVPLLVDYVSVSERLVSPCPSRVVATGDGHFIIRERCSNAIIELSPNRSESGGYGVTKVFRGCDKFFLQDPIDIALYEGHILVIDRAINRQCLVVFDRTGRGKQVLKFDRRPNTICCTSGTLYVGFYGKVCCYTVKPKPSSRGQFHFTLSRTMGVDGKWPWHITTNGKGLVVANLQGKELVCLHQVRKKDRIQTVQDQEIEMRELSFLGSNLLVADRTGSRIFSLNVIDDVPDLAGANIILSSEHGVKNPVGLATGLNGEVLVGQENGKVCMFVAE